MVTLLSIIIALVVLGVLLWLIESYVPMDANIKKVLIVVSIIVVVLWLLQAFGLMGELNNIGIK